MADHHDNDWLIGPGLALDTSRWFLVATELFLLVDELHVRRLAAVTPKLHLGRRPVPLSEC